MKPEFPLRLIFDDGECVVANSPEELIEVADTVDTTTAGSRVWIRDAFDRTVRLRIRNGFVDVLEV